MKTVMVISMAIVMATVALCAEGTAQTPPVPAEEQPEVLTRGPVNEAFAQPVNLEDQAGLVAPTAPPADIAEEPPPERPAGHQIAWVPGYWAWDSERNGYIWISGCWRAVPPRMSWVPGYWSQTTQGYQWVPGFWKPSDNRQIEYLPAPPPLTAIEPTGPAPSPDHVWVPPCWYWRYGQYVRRPGYWIGAQADWVWTPSHYVWTPRGYVFVGGHWDYPLRRRGVLFAPVYFPGHSYARPGYSYALSIAVNIGNLQFGLFTRPQYSHYYFGDYYDSVYIGLGIFPWYQVELRHTWYDPIYVHDRWRHRRDEPRWAQHQRQEYDRRRDSRDLRPPRTYGEMERRVTRMPASQRRNFEIAAPINRVAAGKSTGFTFEKTRPDARPQMSRHNGEVRKFVQERKRWESRGPAPEAARPTMERRPPTGPEAAAPATKDRKWETRPSDSTADTPAERPPRSQPPGSGWKGSSAWPSNQGQANNWPRQDEHYQSDRVNIRTGPVAGRPGRNASRKGLPSLPAEEQHRMR